MAKTPLAILEESQERAILKRFIHWLYEDGISCLEHNIDGKLMDDNLTLASALKIVDKYLEDMRNEQLSPL